MCYWFSHILCNLRYGGCMVKIFDHNLQPSYQSQQWGELQLRFLSGHFRFLVRNSFLGKKPLPFCWWGIRQGRHFSIFCWFFYANTLVQLISMFSCSHYERIMCEISWIHNSECLQKYRWHRWHHCPKEQNHLATIQTFYTQLRPHLVRKSPKQYCHNFWTTYQSRSDRIVFFPRALLLIYCGGGVRKCGQFIMCSAYPDDKFGLLFSTQCQ